MTLSRDQLLNTLQAFANQRAMLSAADYHDAYNYGVDKRLVAQQLTDARMLVSLVRDCDAITGENIQRALQSGGALEIDDTGRLDFTAGQYYPVEFRAAVCRVLAGLLWAHWRAALPSWSTGCDMRKHAANVMGPAAARRLFH